jgi:hypothetical protein
MRHPAHRTRERPLSGTGLQNNSDLPIVFQSGEANVFYVSAARSAQRSRQFMACH